jgi:hypothetical protein
MFPKDFQITAKMITEQPLIDMSMAGISFFNAAPVSSVGAIDLRLGPESNNMGKLFTGLGFGSYSNSQTIPPGKYYIDLVKSSTNQEITIDLMVDLTAGKKFFAVAFAPYQYGIKKSNEELSTFNYMIFEKK